MNNPITILGIPGSLRSKSFNKSLLRAAMQMVPQGVTIESFDIDGIPGFSEDNEKNPPQQIVEFKQKIRQADALLFVTPEYNFSVPGVLKNAIDWASRPYGDNAWDGKPGAVIGASVGPYGTARAQYHLRQIFVTLNILALNKPELLVTSCSQKFDSEGNLTDEPTQKQLKKLLEGLVEWTKRVSAK